ncbi:uncharacterized protein LOC111348629 isoform X1 [Spodoptera litura]|uniref:Uncharacterized protein LOC111348629 isoform X1 n=1 Tax=Spodoptera litura TaxID=69820 RepID=A0A9J7DMR5_SPOLT|nr:uncharacterized protein LOC111348629 isoform X1 [Spodoptera litura]
MPEQVVKVPRSASPVARAGAGDISERELSRERHNLQLQTTPPARVQPAHPKKQLFSAPVNKFTAKWCGPSPNLERIRSCLDAYANQETPTRSVAKTKAASMEDLTPTKRIRIDRRNLLPVLASPSVHGPAEEAAAAKICQFMLVAAWRRRREDVRCLRKTLETQVSYSERLRIQISALKSLLDSDNSKVRLAMRELERLKQLLRDKELEKAVLEREKLALEDDVCAAEDRASEMSIGWRNCRNELDGVRAAAAVSEHALALERAAHSDTLASRDDAYDRLAILEEDLAQHEELLSSAEAEVAALRRETEEKQRLLDVTIEKLAYEEEARSQCSRECAELTARVGAAADETGALRGDLAALRGDLARLQHDLAVTKEQLDWWPRPLTKMLGAARSWFRNPKAVPEAIIWTLIPARHGIP